MMNISPEYPFSAKPRLDQQVSEIAKRYGVSIKGIKSKSKLPEYVRPRFEGYRAARAMGWSYPRIGRYFGKRHHATIMHGIKRLKEMEAEETA